MTIREKIIISANNLFITRGVKGVTMDEIAAEMSMSKRTIYENFANKKDLIIACLMHHQQRQIEQENKIIEQSDNILEELFAIFSKIDESFKRQGKFVYEVRRLYPEIFSTKFESHYEAAAARMKDRIERGVKQGIILPRMNVDFAVFVILETLYSIMAKGGEFVLLKDNSPVVALKYVMTYFFRGISTDKGIKMIDCLIESKNK